MKILHITNHFWPSTGGIEKFVWDLCMESRGLGFECEVLCLNHPHHSSIVLPAHETVEGIRITRVPFWNWVYYKPALLPLQNLREADVLHVHGVGALLDFIIATKPLLRKPIIVSTHGGIFHTKAIGLIKKAYFSGWQRIALRRVDRVVACSKNDFELFKPVAKRLILIENGVELKRFEQCTKKSQKNIFLFVGRLSKNKRIDQLRETAGIVDNSGVDFELRLVGEDWEGIRSKLEAEAKHLGISKQVVFVGKASEKELVEEYCNAKVFVSASSYEGFGISAIEAMAAGCVVILNSIDSFKVFVEPEKNGYLVDYSNPKACARVWKDVVTKDQTMIFQQAAKTAEQFAWKKKIVEWKSLYECFSKKK